MREVTFRFRGAHWVVLTSTPLVDSCHDSLVYEARDGEFRFVGYGVYNPGTHRWEPVGTWDDRALATATRRAMEGT